MELVRKNHTRFLERRSDASRVSVNFAMNVVKTKLKLHQIAVEEYQFQQKLNEDRNRFFLLLNLALILSILALAKSSWLQTIPLLALEIFIAVLSWQSLIRGRVYQKKVFEQQQETKKLVTEIISHQP